MSIISEGADAKEKAIEWGYDGDLRTIAYTRQATHIGCRWVYDKDGTGNCMACGDMDFDITATDEED